MVSFSFGQTAVVSGHVLNEQQEPLANVNISVSGTGTTTNDNGFYLLELVADKRMTIVFSHLGHEDVVLKDIILTTNEIFEFNPVMAVKTIQIAEVKVTPTGQRSVTGATTITPEIVRKIPGVNAGVENILKLLPGVSFNNELSTQYNVRGGNFDENLVYVNGIEVYRPFLIRSAQQEGFSFVNSSLVENVSFAAGGFQAKYGDKLSSVLDITYKIPSSFSIAVEGSLLGASSTLETVSKKKNFTTITGVRYRNNALFVNSQQTLTNVVPIFFDAQTYMTHQISDRLKLGFLGNISINNYKNEPISRQTNFGSLLEPRALVVFYEGREQNSYETQFGALKADFLMNEDTKLSFTSSIYHALEEEFTDVIANYELGEIDTNLGSENLGEVTQSRGIGSQFNRARNQLDALIVNLTHRGILKKNGKSLEWGLRYSHEDFRDRLNEAEFLDSAGFFIRPPNAGLVNNEPEEPFEGAIVPFESVRATNFVRTDRFSGFLQFGNQTHWGENAIYYNLGVRAQQWIISGEGFESNHQFLLSPRAQFAIKPNWENDVLFRLAIGSYQQPPFYRELRDINGLVNPEVEAQRSIHFVAGNEYSFSLFDRPFTLISEAYYKKLDNVNTYTVEDVRIRYRADNIAKAFAYGFDFRLNGAFIPGAESWISLGYLQTKENIGDRGYISRPTDQRLKLGVLFQDYMPTIPNMKLYVNLVYNTGVPGGSPNNADPYDFQNRLRDYRRADLGISYIFADRNSRYQNGHWLHGFKELDMGFEIFNIFNNQNSITNTWVRDVDTQQQFAVPNFLTSRLLNVKLRMKF
ncbi:TonB-dependent receptor [Muricauda sp. SCSIO 64092]|uniref:TonB-dependent receptor n=1 Tax=Allomuricauda sp. SCSIO 64092 TaxID=2908842 RepID=UPI001FF40D40|nr:TonB-dependent receptor [Muricauda sp. SCSIO 64092]